MSCQRYEKGESGRIETPNFPASYRQGSNCRWVIEGPLNSKIQVIRQNILDSLFNSIFS